MADRSSIEWTEATWNPTTGCDRVSAGCDHCYALTLARRLQAMGNPKYQHDGNSRTSGPGFGITPHPDALAAPLRWRRPRRVFVNSMSDLFHADVPDEFIARVFAVMARASQHTFQILTKRHARMRALLSNELFGATVFDKCNIPVGISRRWPLPNVWLGVSVETQQWADIRVPALLDTPAAVRFVSAEPMLEGLHLWPWLARDYCCSLCEDITDAAWDTGWHYCDTDDGALMVDDTGQPVICRGGRSVLWRPSLDWLIVGGESGPGHRPLASDWVRKLRDECHRARVPFFFKQWGGATPKAGGRELDGATWNQLPHTQP